VQKTESKLATEAPVEVENLTTTTEKPEKPKPRPKAKKVQQTESKSAIFPTEGKVNKYGFIYLDNKVLST